MSKSDDCLYELYDQLEDCRPPITFKQFLHVLTGTEEDNKIMALEGTKFDQLEWYCHFCDAPVWVKFWDKNAYIGNFGKQPKIAGEIIVTNCNSKELDITSTLFCNSCLQNMMNHCNIKEWTAPYWARGIEWSLTPSGAFVEDINTQALGLVNVQHVKPVDLERLIPIDAPRLLRKAYNLFYVQLGDAITLVNAKYLRYFLGIVRSGVSHYRVQGSDALVNYFALPARLGNGGLWCMAPAAIIGGEWLLVLAVAGRGDLL
jgi:hypothetical protein